MKHNTSSYLEELKKADILKKGIFDTAKKDYDLDFDKSKSIPKVMEVYFAKRKGSTSGEKRELRVCYDDRKLFINAIVLEGRPDDIDEFGTLGCDLKEFIKNEHWKYKHAIELTQPFTDEQFEYRRRRKLLALDVNKPIRERLEEIQLKKAEKERRERLATQFQNSTSLEKEIYYPSDD